MNVQAVKVAAKIVLSKDGRKIIKGVLIANAAFIFFVITAVGTIV